MWHLMFLQEKRSPSILMDTNWTEDWKHPQTAVTYLVSQGTWLSWNERNTWFVEREHISVNATAGIWPTFYPADWRMETQKAVDADEHGISVGNDLALLLRWNRREKSIRPTRPAYGAASVTVEKKRLQIINIWQKEKELAAVVQKAALNHWMLQEWDSGNSQRSDAWISRVRPHTNGFANAIVER